MNEFEVASVFRSSRKYLSSLFMFVHFTHLFSKYFEACSCLYILYRHICLVNISFRVIIFSLIKLVKLTVIFMIGF